ncbi:transmembrane protein 6/97 [Delphinella strobiligena]|nr:transmembrane protein 6/97 [Delphinella strobiligena]
MATSIWNRKRDLIYLVFFAIHIPVMFLVDLTSLYPAALKPQFVTALRGWYIDTYRDQFFVSPPAWFDAYIWMELIYHVPLSTWALGALLRDDPKVPIHLLMYAVQTAITTMTCLADYMSWTTVSNAEKLELGKLYVPYLMVSVFMGVDMFGRLCKKVAVVDTGKKKA